MAGRGSGDPRTVLEHLLRQRDHTYEEVAREFDRTARQLNERGLTISARHLRRLASGERVGTTPATRRVLQALFGMSISELLRPWEPEVTPEITGVRTVSSGNQSDVELLTMAAERSREFALGRHSSSSPELIDQLADEIRELAIMYPCTPLPMVLGRLVRAQESVLSLLELRQKPANARQLYFLASVVAGLLSYAGNDVGRPQVALTHARTGFTWAEYADHDGLRAWIRGLQSFICYWADQPREAIRYAQAGAGFAERAGSSAAPWLFSGEARAWAALGNSEQAKALIERAERAQESIRPDDLDALGGICTFGRSKQLYYVARALAALPAESAAAESYSIQAVDAYGDSSQLDWDFTCQADSRISLALAQVAQGELDGASESLGPVFELEPEKRIHDLVKTINLVHSSINKLLPSTVGRDLQEEIEAFNRASLPRFPV